MIAWRWAFVELAAAVAREDSAHERVKAAVPTRPSAFAALGVGRDQHRDAAIDDPLHLLLMPVAGVGEEHLRNLRDAGALLMLLIGTLFGIVTFGVLTANLALRTKDPAAVQAVFPMAFLLIFLTTAYQTEEQVPSGVLPAESVIAIARRTSSKR